MHCSVMGMEALQKALKNYTHRVTSENNDSEHEGRIVCYCFNVTDVKIREVAKQNCMRTHTTVLSARTIASLKQPPGKFFSVARNFRNETIDWGHSFEFYQVEGIVVSREVTFKHLLGYLTQYYRKLGYEKVRFRPGFFPYTEMSVESEVYLKDRNKWIECGGAGIFRPEVVKPLLGEDMPVLAWGQGMERGIMEHLGINDLRKLYSNDFRFFGFEKNTTLVCFC